MLGEQENYKGILTIWQVDSFEGGVGSRKQFLLKVARSFEKKNPGVLVMVIDHTEESVKEEIKKDNFPDLISFGAGVEIANFQQLKVKGDRGGIVGEKSYAVAWCMGGYSIIANPKLVSEIPDSFEEILVSQGEYTQPLVAMCLEGMSAKNITVKKPMDAYTQFVAGKTPYFLATQRDINRLERRQMEVITRPLNGYNDLYQYIALTSNSALKSYYAESFIEHLLSVDVQKSLNQIGMLSTKTTVEYDNAHLNEMQKNKEFYTVSAFTNATALKQMQENSMLLLQGQKEYEIKIKNMLV